MKEESYHRTLLKRTLEHAIAHLDTLGDTPVNATVSAEVLRNNLDRPLNSTGVDPLQVIDDLVADTKDGLLGSTSGRFYGWVIGGTLPSALAADWLASTWDQNAALYACGPAVAIVEEVCGRWLKELLGIPTEASFALVTGTQIAHVTCLAAARNSLLASRNWNVEEKGLSGAPRIHILGGSQRHSSVDKAIRLLGLGTESISDLSVDAGGQLQIASLKKALKNLSDEPKIVVLQAGDINTGAFDPFTEVIPLAHEHDAWVHIDGAFGLWANASSKLQPLLRGAELADSWTTDGHKWLNVPFDCGYAFVAHPEPHRNSMGVQASYLIHQETARDQMDWNPEWSRRARGLATYAAIRELGRSGISDLVERCCQHAKEIVTGIGSITGAEVVWAPVINQGLLRFHDMRRDATAEDHDTRTNKVIDRINQSGEAFFGGTTWQGMRCMRVSVCNWRTNSDDVERAIEAARAALR